MYSVATSLMAVPAAPVPALAGDTPASLASPYSLPPDKTPAANKAGTGEPVTADNANPGIFCATDWVAP